MIQYGDIVAGAVLHNNDPRADIANVVVTAVRRTPAVPGLPDQWYAYYQAGSRTARISFRRIFADGKVRAQGYNVVHRTPEDALKAAAA